MNRHKKTFIASLIGTFLVAICCFTPLLVIISGAIGLSMIIPYLDIILFPALGLLLIITIYSFIKWRKERGFND
jgi:mercuric ion transport protein